MVQIPYNGEGVEDVGEPLLKKKERTILKAGSATVPALPSTVRAVLVACGSPSNDATHVARLVKSDYGMTLNLLRAVNSAFYSADKSPVMSPLHAIVLLGFDVVTRIVLDMPRVKVDVEGFGKRPPPLWLVLCARDNFSAHLSQELSRITALEESEPEEAFFCAMFRGLSECILAVAMEDHYRSFLREGGRLVGKDALTRSFFGLSFNELNDFLIKKWNLPRVLASFYYQSKQARNTNQSGLNKTYLIASKVGDIVDLALRKSLRALKDQERARGELIRALRLSDSQMNNAVRRQLKQFQKNSPVYYQVLERAGMIENLLV